MAKLENIDINTMEHPLDIYNKMREIEDQMIDNIHDLVFKYGKKVGKNYELSTYDRRFKTYCLINNGHKYVYVKKVIIHNPEECQTRGHITLVGENKETYDFNHLSRQAFNVYSHFYLQLIER